MWRPLRACRRIAAEELSRVAQLLGLLAQRVSRFIVDRLQVAAGFLDLAAEQSSAKLANSLAGCDRNSSVLADRSQSPPASHWARSSMSHRARTEEKVSSTCVYAVVASSTKKPVSRRAVLSAGGGGALALLAGIGLARLPLGL